MNVCFDIIGLTFKVNVFSFIELLTIFCAVFMSLLMVINTKYI